MVSLRQFALYTQNKLLVSNGVYWSMPDIDREGLLYHEVIYKGLRELYRHTDSSQARKIVASIFNAQKDNFTSKGDHFIDYSSRAKGRSETFIQYMKKTMLRYAC